MKFRLACSVLLALTCGKALAADVEAVRCGANVPAALVGRHMANERVSTLEARHRDLLLKDLGAAEITDQIDAISWSICGKE